MFSGQNPNPRHTVMNKFTGLTQHHKYESDISADKIPEDAVIIVPDDVGERGYGIFICRNDRVIVSDGEVDPFDGNEIIGEVILATDFARTTMVDELTGGDWSAAAVEPTGDSEAYSVLR